MEGALIERGYCHRTRITTKKADNDDKAYRRVGGHPPSAVLTWHRAELITPELITPGNQLRGDAERVREQLRARRQRDE